MTFPATLFIIDLNDPDDLSRLCDILAYRQQTGHWPLVVPPPVVNSVSPNTAKPEPPSPPIVIPAPLWRGTAIMALTIRDDAGANVGVLANGAAVDVWAGPVSIGGYTDRLVISAPGQARRNVWAEGVRKA